MRRYAEVDVFAESALEGNPLAVIVDAEGLTTERMQAIATWTNFSETTFLLPATDPAADYRVRIFTPTTELPFAGHPTLGSAAVWLDHDGTPAVPGRIVQECGVGLVELRDAGSRLAFAAPPLVRDGPVAAAELDRVLAALGLGSDAIVAAAWVDNGPGWLGIELADAEAVLTVQPDASGWHSDDYIGLVGRHPASSDVAIEVRAFFPGPGGQCTEDPVTGSLNASVAQWMLGSGALDAPYVAAQGTAMGRRGRVHVDADADGIWVSGGVVTVVRGSIDV